LFKPLNETAWRVLKALLYIECHSNMFPEIKAYQLIHVDLFVNVINDELEMTGLYCKQEHVPRRPFNATIIKSMANKHGCENLRTTTGMLFVGPLFRQK